MEIAQMRSSFRTIGALAVLVALVCPFAAHAQKPNFTLEQVMSAPFPSDLTASPKGSKVAWVFDARGVRNIWVAEAPDYKGRAVTSYSEDDGQEIGELAWTPDARAIVYTRGGDFDTQGEAPNPTSDPQGVEQAIWLVTPAEGRPRKLAEGHSPAISPGGSVVAYIFKDQIWLAELSGVDKPQQLIHAGGKCAGLKWSPDGSRLAFVSLRQDHSFIGVFDISQKSLRYLDPSVDRDLAPEWSADSKQIAFIRLPATPSRQLFGARRSGWPWSIQIADVATGATRNLWRARDGQGSVFHPLAGEQQLFWMADNRLIFPWEGDGWMHLYSIPAEGGAAALMTSGDFEVEDAGYGFDRSKIVFNSNQDDLDRRHLWREASDAVQPQRLTEGKGIEWAPVGLSDGQHLAFLHSDAHWPARPAVLGADGVLHDLAAEAIPPDFPADQLIAPQAVSISAADGMKLHGQVFMPQEARAGEKHPAIIFFHGGSRRQMLFGWHYMQYYHNAYALNQYLAQLGYIVLSVNYRSGIGYGMEFREALNYGATGASEFNDVLGAGKYLQSRPDVDPKRIGLWGGSYGGYLTALGLARASDLFACGVDFHGVHDWNLEFPRSVTPETAEAAETWAQTALVSSPLADVKTWRSPVLLIQGDDDRTVNFENMEKLVEALRNQGVDFQQMVFPDEVHDFLTHEHWLEAYRATADFFAAHFGGSR
jgi:dipeptidyl aminopeptidase/acylaminoacyl peptidase